MVNGTTLPYRNGSIGLAEEGVTGEDEREAIACHFGNFQEQT